MLWVPQETFVAKAKFASRETKMFLNFFRTNFASSANVSLFGRRGNNVDRIPDSRRLYLRNVFGTMFCMKMFLGLRGQEAKHLFCLLIVSAPGKHFEKLCFVVCGRLQTQNALSDIIQITGKWKQFSRG